MERSLASQGGEASHLFFFLFGFSRQGFSVALGACPGTSSCRPGWSGTHRDPPPSASWVLGLKACTTTALLRQAILFISSTSGTSTWRTSLEWLESNMADEKPMKTWILERAGMSGADGWGLAMGSIKLEESQGQSLAEGWTLWKDTVLLNRHEGQLTPRRRSAAIKTFHKGAEFESVIPGKILSPLHTWGASPH